MIISDLNHLEVVSTNILGGSDVPICVALSQTGTFDKTATVTNNCSDRVRVRVNYAFAADGICQTLDPGQSYKEGRFLVTAQGLKNC